MSIFFLPEGRMFNKWYYLENRLSYHTIWPNTHQNPTSTLSLCISLHSRNLLTVNKMKSSINFKIVFDLWLEMYAKQQKSNIYLSI